MPETSFWSDLTGWDWLTLVGIILVFVGVAGEVLFAIRDFLAPANPYSKYRSDPMPVSLYFERATWESGEARRVKNLKINETICGAILVLGLLFELVGFVPSLRRSWNEREHLRLGISITESNNLVLRSNLAKLEARF